jgi:hypothetical protein
MPHHVSIQPGVLYPQPDYSLSVDREGKWTATQVFLCHRNSITKLMPRPGTAHPEVSFITVDTATAKVTEGDLAEITCNYAGAEAKTPQQEQDSLTYSMGLSLSEEPLLANVRYKNLEDNELEALKGIASGKEKDDSGASYKDKVKSSMGKEALGKIMRGQTSYYSPKVTWRVSLTRDSGVAGGDLNNIGRISSPFGPAPGLAAGRNWILNGVSQSQEGRSFRIEWEWLASDRGGWDPDIYAH